MCGDHAYRLINSEFLWGYAYMLMNSECCAQNQVHVLAMITGIWHGANFQG